MDKAKRIFIVPLLLSSFLFSCNNGGGQQSTSSSSSSSSSSSEETVVGETLSISVYEAVSIPERYSSYKASSSDESIAKAVDGKVLGLSSGETKILFEGCNESLLVKVSDTGDLPFLSLGLSSLSLLAGDSYSLSPSLTYKGKAAEASFFYSLSDSSVASVSSSGAVTGLKEGKCEVVVTASYYGLDANSFPFLSASCSLEVRASSSALLSAESTTIYTVDCSLDGKSFSSETTLSGVYGDGSATGNLFDKALTWVISDPSVLSISGNKVKALKKGKAEVYATFDGGETNRLSIAVDKPYYEPSVEGYYDAYSKSLDLDYSSLWKGGDTKAVAIYDGESPDVNILNSDGSLSFSTLGERNWTIEGENYGYKVKVASVSKIIKTSTELKSLLAYGHDKKTGDYGPLSMDGYFVLGNDIDMNGASLRAILGPSNGADDLDESGFKGTFDGRGHTIKNAVVSADGGGIFGTLSHGATIKNLALIDFEIKAASGALTSYLGGTIENVYIKGKITYANGASSSRASLLANRIDASASIKNVVVEYVNPEASTPFCSAVGYLDDEASENLFEGVYVIGTAERVLSTSNKGDYQKFAAAKNGQYADYASFKSSANLSSFPSNWTFGEGAISFHS